jgi:peptidoglycan-associated lipoprotein
MTRMKARLSLALGLVAVSGVLATATGCDSPGLSRKAKAPVAHPVAASGPGSQAALPRLTSAQVPGPSVDTSSLSVSDAIAKACGIPAPEEKSGASPSFDFDSAQLGDDDKQMLGLVAKCLTEGALRGRSVMLVGRADARGEEEYNMNLGGSRADTVRRYLQDLGVAMDKLGSTSRGELDATGTDDSGFAKDRRVDVQLVN